MATRSLQNGPPRARRYPDRVRLEAVLEKYKAGCDYSFCRGHRIGESVQNPAGFYDNNVSGTIALLLAAQAAGINKMVFSSTCATYGVPKVDTN